MTTSAHESNPSEAIASRCVSIDLEVGIRDARIHRFAAVKGDTGESFVFRKGELAASLAALDQFADGSAFVLGHNLVAFDLQHLAAAQPNLRLLKLPAIDTLRLNPLAFPRNPYHHLVKHYQTSGLEQGQLNDPELDARLTLDLFRDQLRALQAWNESDPDLLTAWHWLTTTTGEVSGMNAFFMTVRSKPRPAEAEAVTAISKRLSGNACLVQGQAILADYNQESWALAYALAWLAVAGGNSVMPPWVRHQFPAAGRIVKTLRDTRCGDPACAWCGDRHDARKELTRWFGFPDFRPLPSDSEGRPLQQTIVEAAMRGEHVLGILPTGTGKSVCYQIPALSRYDKTGALTLVISPLVALMADQVTGLIAHGISSCAAINGLLSLPERADVLERVRLGDIGILIVSPEQLRNKSLRKVLAQREIGAWVLDEAHCISKWGHDFRPDYRYVGRFIREKAGSDPIPPVLCLTATAKPDVVADMLGYFHDNVGIDLQLFDGGAERNNLDFLVVPTSRAEKLAHIYYLLAAELTPDSSDGAIVYCASRKGTEEVASYLREKGLAAGHFHAGLPPESKKTVQQSFIRGELRVIAATNAFGMGIDKPDVRLVIHADIPGSLENYLQEAGRAGRDQQMARCILLYTPEDAERQFSMSARSRLTHREIQAILKSLKTLDRKKRMHGEIVATTGEILAEELDGSFDRDSATDDTRVRTALAWLEEATLLRREENQVQVFPSSLRVASLKEAEQKLANKNLFADYRRQLLSLVQALISADPDEGISTDELMGVSGFTAQQVCSALYELEKLGIASNDTGLTAFVHAGVERSSQKKFAEAAALESALIDLLREQAPDLAKGESSRLQLRFAAQRLKDAGHLCASQERITQLLKSLSADGRSEAGGIGSVRFRRHDAENLNITLQREWRALTKTAELRRIAAERLLEHLVSTLGQGERGTDLLAKTTLGKLHAALDGDLILKSEVKDLSKLLDLALLWLHEQDIVRLNKGLAVFRPAMTIHLEADRRGFVKADFAPLQLHYDEQVVQIHVMAEYAKRGLERIANAIELVRDYFKLEHSEFLKRWLPGRDKELVRQTTPASWRAIVEHLNNPVQQKIVADDREQANVLVLAGPGSGKTRVLVHRIAYLVRVRRENPKSVLALAYNRHAAVEIRRRLADLIGDDAKGVVVMTCHGLAMRLAGVSLRGRPVDDRLFDDVLKQAIALLKGEGLPPEEADELRDRLLATFRWILVDEYQDIGSAQYDLISALAGRTRSEEDGRLTMFAVGDDDQNIYAFAGASVEYIRRFENEYGAKPSFLTDNYRSTRHIIAAANAVIAPAQHRMKADHPITIDRARAKAAAGGPWQAIDTVAQGRAQILPAGRDPIEQALAIMIEFERLATLSSSWIWAQAAIIAREWKYLDPIRSYCELHGIPVQMADEETTSFWRLRETQMLLSWLRTEQFTLIEPSKIERWLSAQSSSPWWSWVQEAIDQYALETDAAELPVDQFIEWLAEWGRDVRRRQTGLMLLTAHRAKGLEFDHVAVLDGGWDQISAHEDPDASRRLFYVAMTRARLTLTLAQMRGQHRFLNNLPDIAAIIRRSPAALPIAPPELNYRYVCPSLKEVDLGFTGRRPPMDPIHHRVSALAPGAALTLRQDGLQWYLLDSRANVVGKLAKAFAPPKGQVFVAGKVRAIIVRDREEEDPAFRQLAKCDRWEVVLPELVFEPSRSSLSRS